MNPYLSLLYFFSLTGILLGSGYQKTFAQTEPISLDSIQQLVKPPIPPKQLLNSGDFYIINEIIIEGNRITYPKIIKRELDYLEGDTILLHDLEAKLKWERNKIFNTNLFITVYVTLEDTDRPLFKNLKIVVKEQWYTIPQLILDPADRNLNEWLFQRGAALNRVNIGLRLFQYNCRGRREALRLTFQAGFTNTYEISYEIPYVDKKQRWGIRPYFSYSNNRSISVATDSHKLDYIKTEKIIRDFYKGGIIINYRKHFFATHSLDLSYNNNHISDTVAFLNPDYFLYGRTRQTYIQARYTYTLDKRDVRQYAHKGYLALLYLDQSGFTNYESQQITSLSATYQKYYAFGNRFLFATRLKGKASFPKLQPYILFKGLGYLQDFVRGYELYPIDGQHYLYTRNSARYRVFSHILNFGKVIPIRQFRTMPVDFYFTVFSDWGVSFNDKPIRTYPNYISDNSKFSNQLLGSIGAGIHFVTFYNSVLRFEYSYNLAGQLNFAFSIGTDI